METAQEQVADEIERIIKQILERFPGERKLTTIVAMAFLLSEAITSLETDTEFPSPECWYAVKEACDAAFNETVPYIVKAMDEAGT